MRGDKRCHFSLFSGTSALSLALFQQADLTAVSGGHRRDSGSGKGKRRRAEERRIPARACTVPHGLRNRQQSKLRGNMSSKTYDEAMARGNITVIIAPSFPENLCWDSSFQLPGAWRGWYHQYETK